MATRRVLASLSLVAIACATAACGGEEPAGVDREETLPDPGPGPHFSVSPVPLAKLARVTPLGFNNKILPTGHTYWDTCDIWYLLPSGRPCLLERLPIRAPGDGVVFAVDPQVDGSITIEGPPGLLATFSHVTPAAGLSRGDTVRAGDTIATMAYEHSFDFGVLNYGREARTFVRPERMPDAYLYTESPIAQFPEPLRSEMAARVRTMEDPLGRLSYDVPGTAAGAWFLEGTPVEESLTVDYVPNQLFLGRLQERYEVRIMVVGETWPDQGNRIVVIDSSDPSWDDITPASGPVHLVGWNLAADGGPNLDFANGTVLVEMLTGERLRIEWFDTHDPPTGFTGAARVYER